MNTTTKETFEQRWERVWKAIDACTKKPSEVRRLVTIDAATRHETNAGAGGLTNRPHGTGAGSVTNTASSAPASFDHRAEFLENMDRNAKGEC